MSLLDRIAAPFEKYLGVKPAVTIPFLAGLILLAVNWAVYGEPFDLDTARSLVGGFVLVVFGVAASPAVGTKLNEISNLRR